MYPMVSSMDRRSRNKIDQGRAPSTAFETMFADLLAAKVPNRAASTDPAAQTMKATS